MGAVEDIFNPADDANLEADAEMLHDLEKRLLAGQDLRVRDEQGSTPLHQTAKRGLVQSTAFLLLQNVTVDLLDAEGQTPLSHAVKAGKSDAAEFLIGTGANVNIADHKGRTPLFFAAMNLDYDLTMTLLCRHADPKNADCDGVTSLQYAVEALSRKQRKGRVTQNQKNVVKALTTASAPGFTIN